MVTTELKERTKTAHLDLEKIVVQRLKDIRTNADYAALLRHFFAYFSHVERAIAPYITADVLPDYGSRRNASYLKKDIEALGGNLNDLPMTTVPEIVNRYQALGALYVMEGSIMGGSIIVKMLEKAGITTGVSFFSGYGESTGAMWGVFTAVLNQQATSGSYSQMMVDTANGTFTHFSRVFEQQPQRAAV